jgi:hypothetical protein
MFRDSSELSLTRQAPGKLAGWVRLAISIACAVSFLAATIGTDYLWSTLPGWVDIRLFRHALTFFISFWLLASFLPPSSLSRSLRVAVLLPVAHAIMIVCAWPVWVKVSAHALEPSWVFEVARAPLATITIITALAFAAGAAVIARRRSGEWVHVFAMLALCELLLLGLWLPIACCVWSESELPRFSDAVSSPSILASTAGLVELVVVPPTLVASAFTLVHARWPARLASWRVHVKTWLIVLFAVAVLFRMTASDTQMVLYSNMLPLVLVSLLVAVVAVVILGAVTWWRSGSTYRTFMRSEQRGATIEEDGDEPVIGLEITSWLRGPRVVQRPFSVATSFGVMPVRGAHLVAPLPAATTQLRIGERLGVLRSRDDIRIAGLATSGPGDPFRTAQHVDAMYVAPAALPRGGFTSAALVMWRPCVAYLLIVSAVALPALAALVAL